ncbi:MAG TPA: type IV secretory system conjugative DNA transfer family protein [Herpetosiphonaceae bacterium]
MPEPVVFAVQSFDQGMREDEWSLDEQWTPFFAGQEGPLRIISMTRRFDLRAPQERIDARLQPLDLRAKRLAPIAQLVGRWEGPTTPTSLEQAVAALPGPVRQDLEEALGGRSPQERATWEQALDRLGQPLSWRRWLKDYHQLYDLLMHQVALRGLHHYLLAWLPEGMRPDDQADLVAHAFDTAVQVADLPPLLPGEYTEQAQWLEPVELHHPFVALLCSYDLAGTWDVRTLHRLLGLDLDLAICVDSAPVSRLKSEWQAEHTAAVTENTLMREGTRDHKVLKRYRAAKEIQELLDTQQLHDVRIVVAVQGRDLDELQHHVRQVIAAGGSRLKLLRPPYGQGPLLQFFGPTPTNRIESVARPRRIPSQGVAVTVPFGLRKPDRTDGILWLLQGDTPILFDPFPPGRAGHTVILGKPGYGKTFSLNTWSTRLAALGCQVVVYEPQGHSRRLVEAAGRCGARYVLDLRQQVNVLDVVATRDAQGRPPSLGEQIAHVTAQLSVLLGTSRPGGDGKVVFLAREWTSLERGILDLALQQLYADVDLETVTVAETPILGDLCDALATVAEQLRAEGEGEGATIAQRVVTEINLRLVRGSLGATFNAHTTVDWNVTHDVTAYDFSAIPDGELRTFFYGQAFAALNRVIRSPLRDRSRPLVAAIDEFQYMRRVPWLATFAAEATKTWRTFNGHFWTIDQDAHTYLGAEGGVADEAMLSIFQNATIKIIFRQDAEPAKRLGHVVDGLRVAHMQQIKQLGQGECVLVWEADDDAHRQNEVFVGRVEPTDAELRVFTGT